MIFGEKIWRKSKILTWPQAALYFIVYIKTCKIYVNIAKNEARIHPSNYELDRSIPKGKKQINNWINKR